MKFEVLLKRSEMDVNSKVCLSIGSIPFQDVLQNLQNVFFAEIRMDLLDFSDQQFGAIFQNHKNLIATYRSPEGDFLTAATMLAKAIQFGCAYIDIDIATPDSFRSALKNAARSKGVKVILSYHNFNQTPTSEELSNIASELFIEGANIAKIACMANLPDDCDRVLSLYDAHKNLVAFCMGPIGTKTRLAAPLLGAPFTYASLKGSVTAPGQIEYEEMKQFLKDYI